MTFQPADAIKCELRWLTGGIEWANVFYVGERATAIAQTDVQGIWEAVEDALNAVGGILPMLSSDTSVTGFTGTWQGAEGEPGFDATGVVAVGTGSSVSLPLQVAAVATIYSTFHARSGRGRIYQSGIDVDQVAATNSNVMSAELQDAMTGTYDAMRQFIEAQTPFELGVLSRFNTAAVPGAGLDGIPHKRNQGVFFPAESVVCRDLFFDSMRSRSQK